MTGRGFDKLNRPTARDLFAELLPDIERVLGSDLTTRNSLGARKAGSRRKFVTLRPANCRSISSV